MYGKQYKSFLQYYYEEIIKSVITVILFILDITSFILSHITNKFFVIYSATVISIVVFLILNFLKFRELFYLANTKELPTTLPDIFQNLSYKVANLFPNISVKFKQKIMDAYQYGNKEGINTGVLVDKYYACFKLIIEELKKDLKNTDTKRITSSKSGEALQVVLDKFREMIIYHKVYRNGETVNVTVVQIKTLAQKIAQEIDGYLTEAY